MNFVARHMWSIFLLAGFLIGVWVGSSVLPTFRPLKTPTTSEETVAEETAREKLQVDLEKTLMQSEHIVAASVHVTGGKAAVTVTFADGDFKPEQVSTITHQVAGAVGGLLPGAVAVYDSQGKHLNLRTNQEHEQKTFWTGVAVNVAKILGILVALITMKFMLVAFHKRFIRGPEAEAT